MTFERSCLGKEALTFQSQEGAVGAKTTRNAHLDVAVLIDPARF